MARIDKPQHPLFQSLNSSVGFDWRLAPYDIALSVAHVKMLAKCGIVSDEDRDKILGGLEKVKAEFDDDSFRFNGDDEDIHMAVERRLIELVGPVGGKLHSARSRNDQVVTDLAMFVRAHCSAADAALSKLMAALLKQAETHRDWVLPGYTHLQRAQPVYLSHHLLAYFWMLARDRQRFAAALKASSRMPLGAGAIAGVNFETDRRFLAKELGFDTIAENSIDAVASRDFVADYLAAAATCATHLSRLGSEVVLWSSSEFGFCEVDGSFASTSSIMPQKKNPDAAELLRAKAPRVVGSLVGIHGVLHGLPLTYNKDLQEDKEGLFDAVDTVELALAVAAEMVDGISFNRERMAEAAADEFLGATDVADYLVKKGVPFREAHGMVADLVRTAVEQGKLLSELEQEQLTEISEQFDQGYYEVVSKSSWTESKISEGGTSLARIDEQIREAKSALQDAG